MNQKESTDWKRDEFRIYIRDFMFLLLTIATGVVLAEIFLIKENHTIVDRIFSYLLLFIPLGSLNFLAHYYYRNRRIKRTGKIRSSFRYQLSLAFMLVSVIPAIPIFLLSASMMEILVQDMFRIDVARALNDARSSLDVWREREEVAFVKSIRTYDPFLFRYRNPEHRLIEELYRNGLLKEQLHYAGIFSEGHMIMETKPVFPDGHLPSFERTGDELDRAYITLRRMDLVLYRFALAKPDSWLILGQKLYPGAESQARSFINVHDRVKKEDLWNVEIPTNIRLGLGLIFVFMIFTSLLISIFIARQISQPIYHLAEATRAVTDGDLNTRIEIKSSGEMGVLIDSFNQMIADLQTLRTSLLHTQRVAAWQEVAKRLAHEIKNPLTPIQLSAQRMLRRLEKPDRGDLEQVVATGASTIIEQVNVLKGLVEEFSNFARLPSAKPVPNSLEAILSETVNLFQSIPGVSVELLLTGHLPLILIDRNVITGVINNLIKNSVEAIGSLPESLRPAIGKVRISTGLVNDRGRRSSVVLRIEDNGPGISDDMKERIFEPYYTTRGESGSGLGLSIVERAVLDHGARIFVSKSAALGGAEFRIHFPVYRGESN